MEICDTYDLGKWPYPVDFLKDYMDFAVKARPRMIRIIADAHVATDNEDEKNLLFILAFE